jgi:hypothetical protein
MDTCEGVYLQYVSVTAVIIYRVSLDKNIINILTTCMQEVLSGCSKFTVKCNIVAISEKLQRQIPYDLIKYEIIKCLRCV